jgi:N6-adenosine-specific RNA methylase IME4
LDLRNPKEPDMTELEFHPLANIFPLMEGAEFEELIAAPVRRDGVREPIWLYEGQILDGRNRYRAALAAGVPCPTRLYEGNDPLGFVIALNLQRRHLDESQRAMVAARLATMRQGTRTDLSPIGEMSQSKAADLLNVGKRSVERAAAVHEHGDPDLIRAVETGNVKVSVAADIATLEKDEQRAILARMDRGEILQAANVIRAERAQVRRAERIERMIEISKGNADLPTDRTYPIILADPPWQYERPAFGILTRSEDEHYPSMALDEICALPVGDLASPNAMLFLWVSAPILAQGLEVIRAWGFAYRTGMVWDKQSSIPGRYVRQQHEHLLIARRGEFPMPLEKDRPPSVISTPRRGHSRKPDEAYAVIEQMYPDLPKIELFARNAREGWAAWGNQAPQAARVEKRTDSNRQERSKPPAEEPGADGKPQLVFPGMERISAPHSERGNQAPESLTMASTA